MSHHSKHDKLDENKPPVIGVRNVSFSYGDGMHVLKDINLDIYEEDFLGIIGPNGGGKSTLLKLIVGILPLQQGSIHLFGKTVKEFRRWSCIGYVSQKASHFDRRFPATVWETVAMGRTPYKGFGSVMLNGEDRELIHNALEDVDMLKYKNNPLYALSGGQQQRVFIARALASSPCLLALDEPTIGIDLHAQEQFYLLLQKLRKEKGLTIILVSHDIDVIATQANSFACLNQGLVFHGEPHDFIKEDYLEKLYEKTYDLFYTDINMFEIFNYSFMVRAFIAGGAIAIIAPMIGTFLVMRRFSLFADSLSHVALAGVAIGIISGIYPVATAVVACIIAAILIEKLRTGNKIHGDAALSLFLSGSLAIALVLISLAHGFNVNLFSYLFGSVAAVEQLDVYIILGLTIVVLITLIGFYRQLFFIGFDEEAAMVSGIKVKTMNLLLMTLAAVVVALSMRIVGILMVGALMVIPVLAALQIAKSFQRTMVYSVLFSLIAVFAGLFFSYQFDIIAGGAIVLFALIIFVIMLVVGNFKKVR